VLVVLAIAAALLLTNLGRDYLWEDEGDTSVFARNILRSGLPEAWDGTTFIAPDYGERLRFGFVMVSHPWLQYYAAAASFALFGESTWAARFPFALAGLATIALVYILLWRMRGDRLTALAGTILLTASVQFLLYARQARNYALHALLTCVLLWQFQRLRSWRGTVAIGVTGIVLFHAHALGLATVAALVVVTLVYPPAASRRRLFLPAAGGIGLYATPWLLVSHSGQARSTQMVHGIVDFGERLLQFAVEYASVTPVLGATIVAATVWWWGRRVHSETDNLRGVPAEKMLVVSIAAIVIAQGVLLAATHAPDDIWILGLHHTPALIPLTMIVAALVIGAAASHSRWIGIAVLVLFAATRGAHLVPWTSWADPVVQRDPGSVVSFHVPERWRDRLLRTTQVQFVRTLFAENRGTIADISDFLLANASPGDVVITNYAWEALYFHTGLPQGAKLSPEFPIYEVARSRALPDYVFGAGRVRWIVWRQAWPVYFREQDCAALLAALKKAGITTELVATIRETGFENRENVHFRRYAGKTYVFPWHKQLDDALIYRVDWESDVESRHQQAEAHFKAGRYKEAIVDYDYYVAHRPHDWEAFARLGVSQLVAGSAEQAVAAMQRAVEIAPDQVVSHRNLANVLVDTGDPSTALEHALTAVRLRPNDAGAHAVLGRALAGTGKAIAALPHFERALELNPDEPDVRDRLARIRTSPR
jgi:Flp pilus assembly protein TadD